jgi:uncharacterized protein YdiU (UPF0061 family)
VFHFDNTYARELEGTFVRQAPATPPQPGLVVLNAPLAEELGLDPDALRAVAADVFSGAVVPEGADPLAQAYAGHQFGGLSPQLGDGRALLLGELVDRHGRRRDLQLKGSGRTPFSRGGDGKAALGPMLREYVMGEAMAALGVPTTRALAVTTTGETVYRDEPLPGAVLARVAASHLRVGTFEFFAIRGDADTLARLVTYALHRHYPDVDRSRPALALFEAVRDAQARLVARWMGVGFVHGVMNTDNVTISGETIDYGPCAFVERHDPGTVFSSIDQRGRYAYGNQPGILGWNLSRFATALLPLVDPDPDRGVALLQPALDRYADVYDAAWREVLRAKAGLVSDQDGDEALLDELLALLVAHRPDHTLAFRALATAARGDLTPLRRLVDDPVPLEAWVARWVARLATDGPLAERAAAMDRVNPLVVPRNHRVEEALRAATGGDLQPLHRLVDALSRPFEARAGFEAYAEPAPAGFTEGYQTFCGT